MATGAPPLVGTCADGWTLLSYTQAQGDGSECFIQCLEARKILLLPRVFLLPGAPAAWPPSPAFCS